MALRKFFPHDVRVEKEARALAAAGHDVSLLCLGRPDEPTREQVGPIDVHRIHRRERYSAPYRTYKTVRYLLTLHDIIWDEELAAFVDRVDADALHIHDLPLVRTGLDVADRRGLPLVADLHENYPEAAKQWRKGMALPRKTVQRTFTPISRLKRLERDDVQRADHVLAITEEGRDHYINDCGAGPDTVHVVSNTVELETFADTTPIEGFDDEFVVSYVGSFGPHRGLETAIKAMPALVDAVPNARLLLVGSAEEDVYEQSLRDLVADLGIEDHVTFTGWVDFEQVPGYMAASDVCFVLHRENPHTATTVPHKLFQYMALSKPVVVTDVGPLGRIVREYDAGRVIDDGAVDEMATAVAELADDALRARLGANGRRAVEETYNWQADADTLLDVYDAL